MQWIHVENFTDLSPSDLYQVLRLRQNIFIIEQECIYDDIDEIDPFCEHLLLKDKTKVVGYSRIVPANKKFEHPSIGRIAVHEEYRGKGFGKQIVQKSIAILSEKNTEIVIIEAQSHLKSFYELLGFRQASVPYKVDGIQHIKMDFTF